MGNPKISVNKLGEYLTATPARRKRIVEDQQNPKAFIAARYTDAREAIVDYVSGGMTNDAKLLNTAVNLRAEVGGTEFSENDRKASADAIENFLDAAEDLHIEGLAAMPGEETAQSTLQVADVNISMRPDILLKSTNGGEIVGAVKLHFSKTNPLTKKGAEYVATALRVHLENQNPEAKIDPKKCIVVDIATENVVNAPKAFKKNMNDISAACEEIKARWSL